jgi:hypothetical protein
MAFSTDPACLLACYGLGLGVKGTVDAANIGRAFAFARPSGSGSCYRVWRIVRMTRYEPLGLRP